MARRKKAFINQVESKRAIEKGFTMKYYLFFNNPTVKFRI